VIKMTLAELVKHHLYPEVVLGISPLASVLVEHRDAPAIAPVPVRDVVVRRGADGDCQLVLVVDHRD
jgi:hypothetical protein